MVCPTDCSLVDWKRLYEPKTAKAFEDKFSVKLYLLTSLSYIYNWLQLKRERFNEHEECYLFAEIFIYV